MRNSVSIIGNGTAALEAIQALRNENYQGEINLISDKEEPAYNPMLTSYYVAGRIDYDDLFFKGNNLDFYEKHQVKLHLGSPAAELDADNHLIRTEAGKTIEYDKCLIATGASPFIPKIAGADLDNVYTMRTLEDALKLKEALKKSPQSAIVVGASMVGIKLVELLNDAGLHVTLADQASCMFPLSASEGCSCVIEGLVTRKGADLLFEAGLAGIEKTDSGIRADFGTAGTLEADIIVVCIGVRPNLGFVNREQIDIDRGILINDHMQTSNQDVYAAGDVSQGMNLLTGKKEIIGLLANARYQGRTAGRNMAGTEDTYAGNIPHNITHFMDVVFTGLGDVHLGNRNEIKQTEDSYVNLVWQDDKLVGVNILGDSCQYIGIIKTAMEKELLKGSYLDSSQLSSEKLSDDLLMKYYSGAGR